MRNQPPRFVAAAALVALALVLQPSARAQRRPAADAGGTVVFAVKKHQESVQIEPVVILRGRRYAAPPVDEGDATGGAAAGASRRFIAEHFSPGRQFRLLFGGGESGSVRVVKYVEPGCVGMYAEVSAQTTVRLGGEVQALATNSKTIGAGPSARRAPTEAERAAALTVARATFMGKGAPPELIPKMEVRNLTAVDLDRDGRFELVGSYRVENNTDQTFDAHTLFIIYEPAADGLRPAMTWHHQGGEAEYADRRLVDHADLDGDGVSEIIAEGNYYESNDYFVYQRQQGQWRAVYHGGGGGC